MRATVPICLINSNFAHRNSTEFNTEICMYVHLKCVVANSIHNILLSHDIKQITLGTASTGRQTRVATVKAVPSELFQIQYGPMYL